MLFSFHWQFSEKKPNGRTFYTHFFSIKLKSLNAQFQRHVYQILCSPLFARCNNFDTLIKSTNLCICFEFSFFFLLMFSPLSYLYISNLFHFTQCHGNIAYMNDSTSRLSLILWFYFQEYWISHLCKLKLVSLSSSNAVQFIVIRIFVNVVYHLKMAQPKFLFFLFLFSKIHILYFYSNWNCCCIIYKWNKLKWIQYAFYFHSQLTRHFYWNDWNRFAVC